MSRNLVKSKLNIPRQPRRHVPRPRLLNSLERQVANHKLTLVTAPAGYGKTTLLAAWARASSLQVAWLSLSEEENDVERFFRYLLAAWETVDPQIRETPFAALLGSFMPDTQDVLDAFIAAGDQVVRGLAFVLDDYHSIEEPAVHEAITYLLDHLPEKLHFILATRSEPPLPLARYRARDQLLEFGTRDLHFTAEESADFLSQFTGLDLSAGENLSLHTRTEGWVAGLQLAALSLRQRPASFEDIPLVSGRQRFIADYLAEDVFNHLPVNVQEFLLKTSILERLCGPLCDAVAGKTNGQSMLELLEHENLFILALDDQREWYRYHTLFAGFLQARLERQLPDMVRQLHSRASSWLAQNNFAEAAFQHALKGGDVEQVIEIIETYIPLKLLAGEFNLLAGWLASLPQEWFATYPIFTLARATFLLNTGALEDCARSLDDLDQQLRHNDSTGARRIKALTTVCRCGIACYQNNLVVAKTSADRGLRDIPREDLFYRAMIYFMLGDTYRKNGLWEEARASYLKVFHFSYAPFFRYMAVHVNGALADLVLRRGELSEAVAYWRRALADIQEKSGPSRLPLPLIGWVNIRLGEILYEWNQLQEADDHVQRGLEWAELGGDVQARIAGYLAASRLKLAQGSMDSAVAYLNKARPLVEQAIFPEWTSHFEHLQLRLWLAQDRLKAAANWADEMLQGDSSWTKPDSEASQLAVAHALVLRGDAASLERAQKLLEHLSESAQKEGRKGIYIESQSLRALVQWRMGKQIEALTLLELALRKAEPEGYTRLFADMGLPMGRLLQEARSRDIMPHYVKRLLAAFHEDLPFPQRTGLPEALTSREKEVLKLIAAGLTNREIARQLVISAETVKTHTGNIYRKLGASNRTEAAALARDLSLLE